MFVSLGIVIFFVAVEFTIGAVISLALCALVCRPRFGLKPGLKAALLGGLAFVTALSVSNWADSHASFINGERGAIASWGEDLRLRNFLAEYGLELALASASIAGLLAGYTRRRAAR